MKPTRSSRDTEKLFARASVAWDKGNLRLAFDLFLQAASLGDYHSQLDLGYFFDVGLHVKKNKNKALCWYYKAYRQGDACGAANIATIHRDRREAAKMLWWFRKAVAMGNQDELLDLGKCYETGFGVPKNTKKAKQFYKRVLLSKHVLDSSKEQAQARLAKL
jgi:uncharacterized protein